MKWRGIPRLIYGYSGFAAVSLLLPVFALLVRLPAPGISGNPQLDPWAPAFFAVWAVLGLAALAAAWTLRREAHPSATFIGYFLLSLAPFAAAALWLVSGPYAHTGSLEVLAAASQIPLLFTLGFLVFMGRDPVQPDWRLAFLLPVTLAVLTSATLEVFLGRASARELFGSGLTASSADRSYWYFVRKPGGDGKNRANSYGFIGSEPSQDGARQRILLLGDSIPAATRTLNFVTVAQELYDDDPPPKADVELVNASIASFSLEQIYRFYTERLNTLKHDIAVLLFYIDDVNRELRYRKNNVLYTPSWPEWMQDVYYGCFACRTVLNVTGFTETTFLHYRTRSTREAFPLAVVTLNRILAEAKSRGVPLAIVNVPRFNWTGTLAREEDYTFYPEHKLVERWSRSNGLAYFDLLPLLAGRAIEEIRISPTDIHFNDAGHKLVGRELKTFLDAVLSQERDRAGRLAGTGGEARK